MMLRVFVCVCAISAMQHNCLINMGVSHCGAISPLLCRVLLTGLLACWLAGLAWLGLARLGLAWLGLAWLGLACLLACFVVGQSCVCFAIWFPIDSVMRKDRFPWIAC